MNRLRRHIAEIQLAFLLLTRLPAGHPTGTPPELAAASWAFPLAGLAVGCGIGGSLIGFLLLGMPALLAAVLALAAGLVLTGALHEDGLADCADGFGGGETRAQKLDIMKDSRVGSYGALALIIIMVARIAALSAFPADLNSLMLIISLAMTSRLNMLAFLAYLPAARTDGLGQSARSPNYLSVGIAAVLCVPALLYSSSLIIYALIATTATALCFALFSRQQIGGQTGDVCGAAQILSETAGWLCLSALFTQVPF